jgi:hypothetical protein
MGRSYTKDHKKCQRCENDNTNPYFCDFCGRPAHEAKLETREVIPDVIKEEKEVT